MTIKKYLRIFLKKADPVIISEATWEKIRPTYELFLAGELVARIVKADEDTYFDLAEIKIVRPFLVEDYSDVIGPEKQLEGPPMPFDEAKWQDFWVKFYLKTGDPKILQNHVPQARWEELREKFAATKEIS